MYVLETITYMENYFELLAAYVENSNNTTDPDKTYRITQNYILMKKMANNIEPMESVFFLGEDDDSFEVYDTIIKMTNTTSLMRISPPLFLADLSRLSSFDKEDEDLKNFLQQHAKKILDLRENLDYDKQELTAEEKKFIIKKGNKIDRAYWQWRKNYLYPG